MQVQQHAEHEDSASEGGKCNRDSDSWQPATSGLHAAQWCCSEQKACRTTRTIFRVIVIGPGGRA
eukprot:8680962-Karenia_brevis.AAC.1